MPTRVRRCPILIALAVVLGCGPSDGAPSGTAPAANAPAAGSSSDKGVGDVSQLGKAAAQAAKDASSKVGDGLSTTVATLETFAKSVASGVSDTGAVLAGKIESKLPDIEVLVEKVRTKLAAGGAEAKAMAKRLEDKLATLKTTLAAVVKEGEGATKQAKDDVVAAFKDLVAEIKTGAARLGA